MHAARVALQVLLLPSDPLDARNIMLESEPFSCHWGPGPLSLSLGARHRGPGCIRRQSRAALGCPLACVCAGPWEPMGAKSEGSRSVNCCPLVPHHSCQGLSLTSAAWFSVLRARLAQSGQGQGAMKPASGQETWCAPPRLHSLHQRSLPFRHLQGICGPHWHSGTYKGSVARPPELGLLALPRCTLQREPSGQGEGEPQVTRSLLLHLNPQRPVRWCGWWQVRMYSKFAEANSWRVLPVSCTTVSSLLPLPTPAR